MTAPRDHARAGGIAAVAVVIVLAVACGDFERMRMQPRYDAYDASTAFEDGMAMRVPPDGTMSREQYLAGEAANTGMSGDTALSDVPLHITPEVRRGGARDFAIYCAVCHGAAANATAPAGSTMRPVPPPSLLSATARAHSAGALFDIITNGYRTMPAYDWALTPRQRWAIVDHVRRLQALPQ